MALQKILEALDDEYRISWSDADRAVLKRSEFDFVMMTRAGFYDRRTLSKYWNVLEVTRVIIERLNQHAVLIDINQFCKLRGITRYPTPPTASSSKEELSCSLSE